MPEATGDGVLATMADNNHPVPLLRRLASMCLVTLAPLAALATSSPALASQQAPERPASASALAGYAQWDGSSTLDTYSESGQAVSVDNYATGEYTVTFDGLGGITGGDAEVSGGANETMCTDLWGPAGANLQVNVWCFAPGSGSYDNSSFSVIVTQPMSAPSGTYDYSSVYKDTTSGTLTGAYQYNSAHKKNSVRHLGTGQYQVTLGGPASTGTAGTVKVTAWGNEPGGCNPTGWHGGGDGEVVSVDCFTAAFGAQNRSFTLVYTTTSNLMGLTGRINAAAYADSAAAVYQPKVQNDSRHGARVTVAEYSPGSYEILFAGSGSGTSAINAGNVQVTAVGTGRQCFIDDWIKDLTPSAYVICVNKAGDPVRSGFTIQWVLA